MVDNLRHVRPVPGHQDGERTLVERHQPRQRQRARDGSPGEFMTESDPARGHGEQAALFGGGQHRDPARSAVRHERVDEPALERGRDHGQLLKRVLNRRVQLPEPGQDRIHDGARHPLAQRRVEQFLGEERIP